MIFVYACGIMLCDDCVLRGLRLFQISFLLASLFKSKDYLGYKWWFSLVSLFNGLSNVKAILVKKSMVLFNPSICG